MIETTTVPITKNESGDPSSGNNYRSIALANVISKVFKSLIRCEQILTTADNQFSFKSRHSTDFCTNRLIKYIEFYKLKNSVTVFVIFLRSSKAFENIDH